MENIKEIDLNKNLVISIPSYLNKEEIAKEVATHFDYNAVKRVANNVEFFGTEKEYQKFTKDKEHYILTPKTKCQKTKEGFLLSDDEKVLTFACTVQFIEEVPSKYTEIEFGLLQLGKILSDSVKIIIQSNKVKAETDKLKEAELLAKDYVDSLKEKIVVL